MRKFRRVKCGSRLPLVQRLADEMNQQRVGLHDMAERAGIGDDTLYRWFALDGNPSVESLAACFGVLGLRLTVAQSREAA